MIRVDALWLACEPFDMRAGTETALARVDAVFGEARLNGHDPYAYLRDVMERLPTQPANRVDELLPHRWELDIGSRP